MRDFINSTQRETGKTYRVTEAYRSISEQDALYAQGRTAPGKIVAYAKGGKSYHNYGLAVDVVEMKEGKAFWNPMPQEVVQIAERFGLQWGGHWKKPDYPHFQNSFDLKLK